MKRVVYRSTSTLGPNDTGILDILRAIDRNNARAGLTGLLWFDGVFFLQAIEGEDDAVDRLFAKLRVDPRHRSLRIVDMRRIEARRFTEFQARFQPDVALVDPARCEVSRIGSQATIRPFAAAPPTAA